MAIICGAVIVLITSESLCLSDAGADIAQPDECVGRLLSRAGRICTGDGAARDAWREQPWQSARISRV
jgi:hypothetical protein